MKKDVQTKFRIASAHVRDLHGAKAISESAVTAFLNSSFGKKLGYIFSPEFPVEISKFFYWEANLIGDLYLQSHHAILFSNFVNLDKALKDGYFCLGSRSDVSDLVLVDIHGNVFFADLDSIDSIEVGKITITNQPGLTIDEYMTVWVDDSPTWIVD